MILKVDKNTYIRVNKDKRTAEFICKSELIEKKSNVEERLSELNDYSDESLLAWAKKNYPTPNMNTEAAQLGDRLNDINKTLEELNG